jgi:hypothetical protein
MITIKGGNENIPYLRVTGGKDNWGTYMRDENFDTSSKTRLPIEAGGAVYGVLTRDDKEQLDRIEAMLIQLKGYIDLD